ncbi:MAG TPA: tRNA 2-selenouridine(34) synthase MnmH [Spirochaetes bacterium]|nr:tRNA 2-selenouridine(34) synthase MnmH [Spirochaetota bacterium]
MGSTEEINYREALALGNAVFIDVRSPSEFGVDHVPGAVNMPVFNDEERALIGKIYRSLGVSEAVLRGTEIAGERVPAFFSYLMNSEKNDVVFYCARGGMRSTALVSLMGALGRRVYKLVGGYREYRCYVRQRLESLTMPAPLFTLHGLAGAGKTAIVRNVYGGLDLEEMAGHCGSVFGALGRMPVTQKHFESRLIGSLDGLEGRVWIVLEGESRKIGDIHLPARLVRAMDESPAILVEAPLERRVRTILDEYGREPALPEVAALLDFIGRGLGKKRMAALRELLARGRLDDFVALLLEWYYDPLYTFGLAKVNVVARLRYEGAGPTARKIEEIIKQMLG